MGNLILWLLCIWIVPLMYVVLRNDTKFKKNLAVGVTIPYAGRSDPEVVRLLEQFKRRLNWICLALLLLGALLLLVKGSGLFLLLLLTWLDLVIVVPYIPYALCNKALKKLKEQRGWKVSGSQETVVNFAAAQSAPKWLSPVWFAIPLILSLLPAVWDRDFLLLYATDGISIFFCWLGYRYLYRNRAETVDENLKLTQALTRIRRYNWGKCWLLCSWVLVVMSLGIWLTMDYFWLSMALMVVVTAALVGLAIRVEFTVRRLQEQLTRDSGKDFYVDEDDKWIWGIFYYNPHDRNLLINDRVGLNTSFNLAKRSGRVIMALLILILAGMPFMGVWIMREEAAAVELILEDEELVGKHLYSHYEIPLEDIREAELLEELPEISKVSGTSMDNVKKGNFKSRELGRMKVCLDPRESPYLLLTLEDGSLYLLGSSSREETLRSYAAVQESLAG